MPDQLTFVHLSDIHFTASVSGGPFDLDQDLRNELERDLSEMSTGRKPFAGVLVSGDIAFQGHVDEYQAAREWLKKICDLIQCPDQNVWIVPGNHDIDRKSLGMLQVMFRRDLRDGDPKDIDTKLQRWLSDANGPQLLLPLRNWLEFAASFQCNITAERPSWHKDLKMNDGSTLRLLGLNSALISDESDNDAARKLVVGNAQCRLERQEGLEYLVMCHHPPHWLMDHLSFVDLVNSRARIQLYGHQHRQRMDQVNNSLRLFAGALHPNRSETGWTPQYNILSSSVESVDGKRALRIDVFPRVWSETATRFVADHVDGDDDVRTFRLELGPWTPGRESVDEHKEAPVKPEKVASQGQDTHNQNPDTESDPFRRLVYRYLTLPYTKRLAIALRLRIIREEDTRIEEPEFSLQLMNRAKAGNLLADLWDEVEFEHTGKKPTTNPFRRQG